MGGVAVTAGCMVRARCSHTSVARAAIAKIAGSELAHIVAWPPRPDDTDTDTSSDTADPPPCETSGCMVRARAENKGVAGAVLKEIAGPELAHVVVWPPRPNDADTSSDTTGSPPCKTDFTYIGADDIATRRVTQKQAMPGRGPRT